MKFTEIYDKLKITDIQEGQFEEKLLNFDISQKGKNEIKNIL